MPEFTDIKTWTDRLGHIWFGTEGGLWRLRNNGAGLSAERVPLPSREEDALRLFALVEDQHGTLWAASSDGLYAIETGGRITRIGRSEGLPDAFVHDTLVDSQGRIWAATTPGISRIAPGLQAGYL